MGDIRFVTLASLLIVFLSAFFIHFAFNNLVRINEACVAGEESSGCRSENVSMMFTFSFAVLVAFIMVIETTIYFVMRGIASPAGGMAPRTLGTDRNSLLARKSELEHGKRVAMKKFLNRQLDEMSFEEIRNKYDKEILEIEMSLEKIKRK